MKADQIKGFVIDHTENKVIEVYNDFEKDCEMRYRKSKGHDVSFRESGIYAPKENKDEN